MVDNRVQFYQMELYYLYPSHLKMKYTVAKDTLTLNTNYPGSGNFKFKNELKLTKDGMSRSKSISVVYKRHIFNP